MGASVRSTSEEGRNYEEAKSKAKHAQDKAAELEQETKEASESWVEWAKERIGLTQEEAKETATKASDMASDAAKKTRDKFEEAVSGLYFPSTPNGLNRDSIGKKKLTIMF